MAKLCHTINAALSASSFQEVTNMKIIEITKSHQDAPRSCVTELMVDIFSRRKSVPRDEIELEWSRPHNDYPSEFAEIAKYYDFVAIYDCLLDNNGNETGAYFTFKKIDNEMCDFLRRHGSLCTYDALKLYANKT